MNLLQGDLGSANGADGRSLRKQPFSLMIPNKDKKGREKRGQRPAQVPVPGDALASCPRHSCSSNSGAGLLPASFLASPPL